MIIKYNRMIKGKNQDNILYSRSCKRKPITQQNLKFNFNPMTTTLEISQYIQTWGTGT